MLLGRIFKSRDPDNRRSIFWMEALAEFVLVVVGILLALQIDNWNQERQDRRLERVLLNEMLSNLQSDLSDVEFNISLDEDYLRSARIVIDYLESERGYHDSLSAHFGCLDIGTLFMANTSSFESMESIGIDLVRNDSLRQQITYLYSATYNFVRELEDILANLTINRMHIQLSLNVRPDNLNHRASPLDPIGIKRNNEFYSAVIYRTRMTEIQLQSYRDVSLQIRTLIHDIEKELEK